MLPIVTISRGSYSRGKEVAEKVADRLGYECISREILVEASAEFNVPEVGLLHAIQNAPSILDRFTFGKERYVAYVQAALLEHLQRDNIVYHGLAGHFFVRTIPHVLKVRIIADMADRAKLLMAREGIANEDEALHSIRGIDEARRKWGLHLYGIDTHDPSLYDLVIRIHAFTADDAVDLICQLVEAHGFDATAASQQEMADLVLSARLKAGLIEHHPRIDVATRQGVAYITVEGASARQEKEIEEIAGGIPGVKRIQVNAYPFLTPD